MRWPGAGPRVELDFPVPGTAVAGTIGVVGWAIPRGVPIDRIEASLGDGAPVRLDYGQPRPDVAAAHRCDPACGFSGLLSGEGLPAGPVELQVVAVDRRGRRATRRVRLTPRTTAEGEGAALRAPADGPALGTPPPAPPARKTDRSIDELGSFLARLRDELDRDPALLDASGLGLAAELTEALVVTPLERGPLPYAERSFDVVALDRVDPERVAVARALARHAVLRVRREHRLEVLWRGEPDERALPSVAVVIPAFNQSACTSACLEAVLETWPPGLAGEVLVVDDASTDDTAEVVARWSRRDERVRLLRHDTNRGFVAACNTGAQAAGSDVLVFLNNDTLPRRGWLPPLLSVLGRSAAGAVGGKLLYPDGVLQEAGGVVFSDADGWNFGKGEAQPGYPVFDHVREVDYCSGALLATPRALFQKLGGFDTAFAPAYYEDTDYAFRLRAAGHRVYYQPASEVVHLEGASAGRDLASGMKRHQAVNRTTFASRWAEALREQPAHPPALDRSALHRLQARGKGARRALVVLPTMPELDRESGSRRAYHLIELLLEAGWATSVVVENATGGERYSRAVRQLGAAFYSGPATRGAGADSLGRLTDLIDVEPFDLAILAFWHVAERHLPALRARSPGTRVLVDSVDLHFLREARRAFRRADAAGGSFEALDGRFADELRRELNVYAAADGVLTVSAKEAAWVDDLLGAPGHALRVPDLEDPPGPARPFQERRGLVFLGNFRHQPNVEALAMLGEVVARLDPRFLAEQPVDVVGNDLERSMLGALAQHPHVRAVGWVPAVEPYLERARLSLAPLRHGAGTKRKLLQAALAGTPSVATSVAIEGLGLEDGREVLVADEPSTFAAAVERLAGDRAAWERFSTQGQSAVLRAHGRETVRPLLHAAIDAVLARPPRS
jgi:GT2 family glycosyltransferase